MILCEQILGNLKEEAFAGRQADFVEIEWFEAYKKLHQKKTENGVEIGIRLGDEILKKGVREGDVLYQYPDGRVIAVRIPACEAIVITVDGHHPGMAAKVCYEIGNKHAALLWGNRENQYITPYNEPTLQLLLKLHGVHAEKKMVKLDFDRSISSAVSSHTH